MASPFGGVKRRRRLQCPLCKETLSYSAFCRHQQTQSCIYSNRDVISDSESGSSDVEFGDPDNPGSAGEGDFEVNAVTDPPDSSSSSSESDLAPEIWDSDSEPDDNSDKSEVGGGMHSQVTVKLHYILSYFLLFFQLCYHVSDRGLQHILNLISAIFHFLPVLLQSDNTVKLATDFPKTLYSLKKQFNVKALDRYCVCPSCHSVYEERKCIITQNYGNVKISRKCDYIQFPCHPHRSRRLQCGTELMKVVKVGKKSKLVPRMLYVYNSIKNTIEKFASRHGFFESCEAWRNFNTDNRFMTDVFDGKLWNDWKDFLAVPGNLLVMLNVDWFRPFKHTTYSVGIMYLAIQNLPRTLRFKPENIIIVGALPGPHEPKLNINTYLKPMVDELLNLWDGIQIIAEKSVLGVRTIRVALACISCDIPATRKLCGFYGFKAKYGCSKCMKEFLTPTFSESTDYSGFDRENWQLRDTKVHREQALKAEKAVTKSERVKIEREVGVRYSDLLRLPYLDIVRCHMIDPMHNLFLGTAKNVTSLWKETGILTDSSFIAIQEKIDSLKVPACIGRLPGKIASGFSGFTAEQWMLWTIVYSPFVLKNIIPSEHYDMWCVFSLGCSLLCRPFIQQRELVKADELLMKFCKMFEDVFEPSRVTPNMHLHAHLRQCVEDLGPVYSFWCFSFERYNGILESFQKNWRSPEVQIMEKFILMQTLNAIDMSVSILPEFSTCLDSIKKHYSILEDPNRLFDSKSLLTYENNIFCSPTTICATKSEWHRVIPPLREKFFTESTRQNLQTMYSTLYNVEAISHVPLRYEEFSQLQIFGQIYSSLKYRSQRSCAIMAMWPTLTGKIIDRSCNSEDIRNGLIEYFVFHRPTIAGISENKPHILAKVKWYEDHPRKNWFKNSIILSATLFVPESESSLYL